MVARACTVEFMGIPVGTLAYLDELSPYASFEYDPNWVREGFALNPLHMPLTQQVYQFAALAPATYKGLPSVFADSLPDDFGNALINAWLARSGQDASQFSAIDRLLYTGTRGMGALEYQNAIHPFGHTSQVSVAQLLRLAQSVLDERNQLKVSPQGEHGGLSHLLQVGTSAGGARPKAVIAIDDARSQILSGQGRVPAGFTHYLLKFDGVVEHNSQRETFGDPQGFGAMEYTYYQMAVDCGITMQHCELLHEGGRAHFLTRRFDREGNQKYHVLTLCAMDHADYKKPGHYSYEELLSVARRLGLSRSEQLEIFKRMLFNVVARNQDDHTKNTAFYVNDAFEWRLAPAYDIAYSYKPGSDWVDTHQMTINGKRDHFTREDFYRVASLISKLSPKKVDAMLEVVIKIVSRWPEYAQANNVQTDLRDTISQNLRLTL